MPERPEAVERIYLAKRRPDHLALPVLAASLGQVRELGVQFPDAATILAARWWPGPLTMAFGFSDSATDPSVMADRKGGGRRAHTRERLPALGFMRDTGVLLVTSANRHGQPTPPSAGEAGGRGAARRPRHRCRNLMAAPSTLVNVHAPGAVVEREGAITVAAVSAASRQRWAIPTSAHILAIETSCDETAAAVVSGHL